MDGPSSNTALPRSSEELDYDVVVIGGAFAGAATALLLKRFRPATRIAVIERRPKFDRKVGEATVEVSALFLHKVLRLYDHLAREQLSKHGLRFWFSDGPDRALAEMSEVGPRELPTYPTFQLDRAKMDEELLRLAGEAGCTIFRPAGMEISDQGWPVTRVAVQALGGDRVELKTRWLVDASGREGALGKQMGLRSYIDRHPTAAMWGRWHGVTDFDGVAAAGTDARDPRLPSTVPARRLATNHFMGYGYWCWCIPLKGGETSIGLVFDRRHADFLSEGPPRAVFERFVRTAPGLRELTANATLVEGDFAFRRKLAYISPTYAGEGWAMVGDAASFLDPFYSPGLDHVSMSAFATVELIERDLEAPGDRAGLEAALAEHNGMFGRSLPRWLDAIYTDKYELMGDAELMRASYLIDTALYHLAVVGPLHRDIRLLRLPTFGSARPQAAVAAWLMRGLKTRLIRIARARRQFGTYGRRNVGWHAYGRAFDLGQRSFSHLARGLKVWLEGELQLAFYRLRRPGLRTDIAVPVMQGAGAGAPDAQPVEASTPAPLPRP